MAKVLLFLSLFHKLPSQDQSPVYPSRNPVVQHLKIYFGLEIFILSFQPFIAIVTGEERTRLRRLLCDMSAVLNFAVRLGCV